MFLLPNFSVNSFPSLHPLQLDLCKPLGVLPCMTSHSLVTLDQSQLQLSKSLCQCHMWVELLTDCCSAGQSLASAAGLTQWHSCQSTWLSHSHRKVFDRAVWVLCSVGCALGYSHKAWWCFTFRIYCSWMMSVLYVDFGCINQEWLWTFRLFNRSVIDFIGMYCCWFILYIYIILHVESSVVYMKYNLCTRVTVCCCFQNMNVINLLRRDLICKGYYDNMTVDAFYYTTYNL